MAVQSIQLKRIYDDASEEDGYRVLVDRLWPRGVSKEAAWLDEWNKRISPSPELRKWFDHEPEKFEEFKKRYKMELADRESVIDELFEHADGQKLTLLFAAKDQTHNHAVVLKEFLEDLL